MVKNIRKRDENVEIFDLNKVSQAMQKALDSVKSDYTANDIKSLASDAYTLLDRQYTDEDGTVDIEDVQDVCEKTLAKHGEFEAARSFILYRESRKRLREQKESVEGFAINLINGSLGVASDNITEAKDPCAELDVIHNQNASTAGGTIGASILQISEAVTKIFWESLYDPEIIKMSQIGEENVIYIHDMGMLAGYCAGWSLKDILTKGLGGVKNKIASAPPKHLVSTCAQIVNFLGIMQNEWAGAQAISSFDTYLAPYVKVDNLSYKEVKQAIQIFVFGLNVSSRWGSQCPFSNITLDWTVPDDMANLPAIVGGKEQPFTYGECQKEADMINKAFLEIMIAGDANGRGFQYPIPTYSITKEFNWSDSENNRLLFEFAAKYGGPYFSNYINSDMKPSDVRSMCCRLRLDLRELRKQNGGNFGAGENTGSIGVVTIDLPQIAYLSESENDFFRSLEKAMIVAARSLDIKRRVVNTYLERGAYPYTKVYLSAGYKNHFSTIGLVGMNEACLNANWIGEDLTSEKSLAWAGKVLDFMRNKLSDFQEQYGCLFNLEATPAESTCYTLARKDKKKYPGIKTAGKTGETPYYTNSSHLPVGKVGDIFDALDMEDDLQTKYTSGTVFHAFLGERLPDWKAAAKLVKTIATNYKLPYFTLSPTYSICEDHGYILGEAKACPHCGKPTEVYSRITGYYRPVSNWNAGKSQEFEDRMTYDMSKIVAKSASASEYAFVADMAETLTEKDDSEGIDLNKEFPCENRPTGSHILLAVGTTCSKCRMVENQLNAKGIEFDTITADDPNNHDFAINNHIMSVPVMFLTKEDGKTEKIDNFGKIIQVVQAM